MDDDGEQQVDEQALAEARRRARERKLEASAGKVAVIAGASLILPFAGVLFAAFALYGSWWCLGRARALELPKALRRAQVGLALGLLALGAQALWIWLALRGV